MKPLLKYRGGKSKEIKEFIRFIPRSYDRYVEPFAGGGALFFYIEPSKAIINDINSKLIDFYLSVRDDYDLLKSELRSLECEYHVNQQEYEIIKKLAQVGEHVENKNEVLYYRIRDMFNGKTEKEYLDATLYYFINRTSFSGMLRFNSKGEYNVPFGRYKSLNTDIISKRHQALLQRTEVLQLDYAEVFDICTEQDFVFLDPPYDCVFTEYGNLNQDFSRDDHILLANRFKELSAKAMMVIGRTDFIEELYQPFIKSRYAKQYSVNIRNRFKSQSEHLIITNYDL